MDVSRKSGSGIHWAWVPLAPQEGCAMGWDAMTLDVKFTFLMALKPPRIMWEHNEILLSHL